VRLLILILLLSSLTGCFHLTGIEHKISVGMERRDQRAGRYSQRTRQAIVSIRADGTLAQV
jgi:hypothetical protein